MPAAAAIWVATAFCSASRSTLKAESGGVADVVGVAGLVAYVARVTAA